MNLSIYGTVLTSLDSLNSETSVLFFPGGTRDKEGLVTQKIPSSSVPIVLFRDVKKKTLCGHYTKIVERKNMPHEDGKGD